MRAVMASYSKFTDRELKSMLAQSAAGRGCKNSRNGPEKKPNSQVRTDTLSDSNVHQQTH